MNQRQKNYLTKLGVSKIVAVTVYNIRKKIEIDFLRFKKILRLYPLPLTNS